MGYSTCWDEANKAALSRQCEKKLSKGELQFRRLCLAAYYRKPQNKSVYKRYIYFKYLIKKSVNMHYNMT